MLFEGVEKLGKKILALDLISSVFNESFSNHPDFILIEHESKQIHINQIRGLKRKLSLKPVRANLFGVVVDRAHLMTREAQNCFLKTLEEPKAKSLLILITEHPHFLLPTILSRCESIKFYPVEEKEIKNYLESKELSEQEIKDIAKASLGRQGEAVDFVEDPEKMKERKKIIKELVKL